ncbi:twin-arginine translocation signal domain-containing protein [Halodesulfurarchaeum sp. HSR-GB]|uniref:twin-arginine translocation signal domain-containing protein n=1 Tax=Halodesulfurarchaeum sp. HSR-GB TaxID=3074077 RepID=UPI00286489EE|nr:twin-arginine translocation signal domain-containing protein [Halodesulfurarchaeum sp. HSR-GB]MDR5656132.1 twin-arginine translocation signal domain-containing protein [Halodesulfurarchaeum sp. HSR-GB]
MTDPGKYEGDGIDRRTLLKGTATLAGAGLIGVPMLSGSAAAKPNRTPCHRDFTCSGDGTYVKFEFVIEEDDEGNVLDCYFEEETDTGLLEITDWEHKPGEPCEPIAVEWDSDTHVATTVLAFGGRDCELVEDPGTSYNADGDGDAGLDTPSGQTAAISNLQFCVEEAPFPACPFYGTTRSDPTAINSIQYDAGLGAIVETSIGDIPDDFADSNYPNGVAFDDASDVWYFAEKNGALKTMNEDGALGIEEYGVITPANESIAGAAFRDDTAEYLFIPNGTNRLMAASIAGGSVTTRDVVTLNWSVGLGDLAINRAEDVLYVSTTSSDTVVGALFFSVDLQDPTVQTLIASEADGDRTEVAIKSQIAFDADETLWAHNAGTGEWRTVTDLTTGALSDVVATTREYTDLARCGFAEYSQA